MRAVVWTKNKKNYARGCAVYEITKACFWGICHVLRIICLTVRTLNGLGTCDCLQALKKTHLVKCL